MKFEDQKYDTLQLKKQEERRIKFKKEMKEKQKIERIQKNKEILTKYTSTVSKSDFIT